MSNSLTLYPFLPDVSPADIAEIAALSKAEKYALKLKINQFDLRDILPLAEKNGGIICPFCGNGSGKDGTGIIPKESKDKNENNYLYIIVSRAMILRVNLLVLLAAEPEIGIKL